MTCNYTGTVAIREWCREQGVNPRMISSDTIWCGSHGEADDVTTLLARTWDGPQRQPTVGVINPKENDE
jgi:hypothetical protein